MGLSISYTATAKGKGQLTAGVISEFTERVPDKATVVIANKKAIDQRDADTWSLEATWVEDNAPAKPPAFSYPPGVRGGSTEPIQSRHDTNATGRPFDTL